ncbi:MAG: hypothetical protein EBY80_10895 [Actinobacteria bacterium]|nr:hypothetical protein [Actinomycetota bacterium]
MDLNHSITVNQSIAETWKILTDLERIAPCLPGAQLQEVEGDVYKGVVKIKVGPIVAQFKGEAQFAERDDANYTATLKASGRDTGGKGNASATITVRKIEGPAAEPLNLQDVAGGAMMKRILPLLAGLAALGLFLKRIFSRRRKKA